MNGNQKETARSISLSWLALCWVVVAMSGCKNPCRVLAERICDCEPTRSARITCEQLRITSRDKDSVTPTAEEEDFCEAKLETCTCADLDANRTDRCGFSTTDAPMPPDDSAPTLDDVAPDAGTQTDAEGHRST